MSDNSESFIRPYRFSGWCMAMVITLCAAGFHIYFWANAGGFWRDEVNLINLSGADSFTAMARDSFPVLMSLLVKINGWLGLNAGNHGLRLLGLLIGLGGIAGLWLVAGVARRSPPMIGLTLLGLNATVISYGDSLRAYGLGSVLVIILFAATVWFLKQSSWPRAWVVSAVAVLAVQTLFHNAVFVGAICLSAMAACLKLRDRRAAVQILTAGALAAVSLVPYTANLLAARESSAVLRTGFNWAHFFLDLTIAFGFPWKSFVWVWAFVVLAVVVVALKAAWKGTCRDTDDRRAVADMGLFSSGVILVSVAGYMIFLWMTAMPGQPWYFIPVMAVLAAAIEAAQPALRPKPGFAILAAGLFTVIVSVPIAGRDLDYRLTNVDRWAGGLQSQAKPGDYIVVLPWFYGITFNHYFHGTTPWTTLPPLADHAFTRYDLVREQMQKPDALGVVRERILAALKGGHRVWLLAPTGALQIPEPGTPPPPSLPPPPLPATGWLDEPYSVMWALQTMQLLSDHSTRFGRIENPDRGRHIAESMELFMAEGWRPPADP